jgi:hypothetical protein
MEQEAAMRDDRRNLLKGLTGIAGAWAAVQSGISVAKEGAPSMDEKASKLTVRDKFWVWGHVAGSHNDQYGLFGSSRMTPAEGAFYLDVPNLQFIGYPDPKDRCKWLPEISSFEPYAISFRPLKRVVWFISGNRGWSLGKNGLDAIRGLAQKFPNIVGVQMDDFIRHGLDGSLIGGFTPKELAFLRSQLQVDGHQLDLWVTIYSHDISNDLSEYLSQVDVVTFWTWRAPDLDTLEDAFAKCDKAAPRARKVLGCYMWNYGESKPMPIPFMQKQCELGLKWLRQGRIEGMIFLASNICDLNLETVEWTRNWIRDVGNQTL